MQDIEALKYPIGKYNPPTVTYSQIQQWIEELAAFPQQLAHEAGLLNEMQLETHYRPGGWTARQVINHLADSHINAYVRVHLALTEEKPVVRPYDEEQWAMLPDGKTGNIQSSIAIIRAIHERLVSLLRELTPTDFDRTYIHPAVQKEFTLGYLVGNYAWQGKHHLAHIQLVKNEK